MKKRLLPSSELKSWLHRDGLTKTDKLLIILATADAPLAPSEIYRIGNSFGFKEVPKANISSHLKAAKGKAINLPNGWELSDAGLQHLRALGVSHISPAAVQVATDLRDLLKTVSDDETRAFLEEAIQCHEFELYRSAVVMSWLAAVHVLKEQVLSHHLAEFNKFAVQKNPKWKPAKTTDDLGLMFEGEFLDRLMDVSLIGKNVKQQLKECLDLRNGCGHPNTMKLGPNMVASHLEVLLLNVFQRFC